MRHQKKLPAVVAAVLICACSLSHRPPISASSTTAPITLTDQTGRPLSLASPARRVVSLAPNMTEILYAAGGNAIGVTTACDYPEPVRTLPRIGGLDPDFERIIGLQPDLVLATTAGNRMESVDRLRSLGIPVYTSNPKSISSILASITDVATLVGSPETGAAAIERIRLKIAEETSAPAARLPRVLCLIWPDPPMTIGRDTFVHELVSAAGGQSVTASYPTGYPIMDLESFVTARPDVIVLTARAGETSAPKIPANLRELANSSPIVFMNEDLLLRPGPRIGDAVTELRALLRKVPR